MKILSAKQIKEAEEFTMKNEPVSSLDLMERAARACYYWIKEHYPGRRFYVFCGSGNNGGDGLAIARMLKEEGLQVSVIIVPGESSSPEFESNLCRITGYEEFSKQTVLPEESVVIDAIFGIGISRNVSGIAADAIDLINRPGNIVISIDIPSGLFPDRHTDIHQSAVVKARHTLTFEFYKLAFFFSENYTYTGEVIVLPIGIHKDYKPEGESCHELIGQKAVRKIIKPRMSYSHKGNYGHSLLICGSYGKIGAAVLAAKACLRSGVGLLTVQLPSCGYEVMQSTVPEAMVVADEEKMIATSPDNSRYHTIGIGPGIGTSVQTINAFEQVISNYTKPMIIDADGINIMAENKVWLAKTPEESIFTPHPKEFERLAGSSSNSFERHELQLRFSKLYRMYVVLKGKFTCITCPDGSCYFNPTGNPGMAKAGSGDTLTGIITALLAQGYSPKESCIAGVYLHGLAADLALEKFGENALLASDIIDHIGKAFLEIRKEN